MSALAESASYSWPSSVASDPWFWNNSSILVRTFWANIIPLCFLISVAQTLLSLAGGWRALDIRVLGFLVTLLGFAPRFLNPSAAPPSIGLVTFGPPNQRSRSLLVLYTFSVSLAAARPAAGGERRLAAVPRRHFYLSSLRPLSIVLYLEHGREQGWPYYKYHMAAYNERCCVALPCL